MSNTSRAILNIFWVFIGLLIFGVGVANNLLFLIIEGALIYSMFASVSIMHIIKVAQKGEL